MPIAEGIVFKESGGKLVIGPINMRRQWSVQGALVDIADHPHYGCPRILETPADAFAEGILTRPGFLCQRRTHYRRRLVFQAVFWPKEPAPHERDAHGLKVVPQHPGLGDCLWRPRCSFS